MLKRLKVEGKAKQKTMRGLVLDKELPNGQTSNPSEGGTPTGLSPQSDPEGNQIRTVKATGEKEINSETIKRPRGRPKKMLKQTNEITSDSDRSSHKLTNNIEVKEEVNVGDGEGTLKEKTLEKNMVIQQMDNNSNLTERNLSTRKGDKLDLVTDPDLHKQEKGKLTEAGEKATFSSVHKFYMRRSSNQTRSSNKG
uniref:Uncharacterized protein n=1 Tax=Arundo donax TaxID=35708 RepID=A0A0A8XZ37_ARUDO